MATALSPAPTALPSQLSDRAAYWRVAFLVAGTVTVWTLVTTFSLEKLSFLYKDQLHLSASAVATLGILIAIPNYLRPLIGASSDLFPLFGYHRRSYYALAALLSALGFGLLSLFSRPSYWTTVFLVMASTAGLVMLLVLADTMMVTVGNRTGTVGRIQSVQQFLPWLLSFVYLAHLSGFVTQHWSYARCFQAAALLSLLSLPLTLLIDEVRTQVPPRAMHLPGEAAARADLKHVERAQTVAALRDAARSPGLWAIVAFVFYLIFTPGTNTALFYYKTNTLHFSKQFIGDLGQYGAAGAMLGIVAFALVSRRASVLTIVLGAWLLDCGQYAINFALHDALTAKVVTFVAYFLGIVYVLCLYTLAARACPPQISGTIYGLFMAAIGLAGALGEKVGGTLYDSCGPASHHSAAYGWYALNAWGLALTIPAGLLIFFLPAWAKSRGPRTVQMEAA